MAENGRFSRTEALAIGVAAGLTVREAAATAEVPERSAYRRATDPKFRQRVNQLRAGMVEAALGKLSEGLVPAAETMKELLTSNRESVRLAAAKAIIEAAVRLREQVDVEGRLLALEERVYERSQNKSR